MQQIDLRVIDIVQLIRILSLEQIDILIYILKISNPLYRTSSSILITLGLKNKYNISSYYLVKILKLILSKHTSEKIIPKI